MFSDILQFLDDTPSVLRHATGENVIILLKFVPPLSHCLPLEFTW